MPGAWKEALAHIAGTFHFAPSEMWAFDVDDLEFWLDEANLYLMKQRRG